MNRLPRTTVTLALAATLLSAAVPAAQARTFSHSQSPSASGSWVDLALGWLGNFSLGAPPAARSHQTPTAKSTTLPLPTEPLVGAHPMGCSTIDPNGNSFCHGGA